MNMSAHYHILVVSQQALVNTRKIFVHTKKNISLFFTFLAKTFSAQNSKSLVYMTASMQPSFVVSQSHALEK